MELLKKYLKQAKTIPTILSFIRIALIPVFLVGGGWYVACSFFGFFMSKDSDSVLREIGTILNLLKKPVPWIVKKLLALIKWMGNTLTSLWSKVGIVMMSKTRQRLNSFRCIKK